MLTSDETREIKNPRERFKMLSKAWRNVELNDLQRYNMMNKEDEERFETDVMKFIKT